MCLLMPLFPPVDVVVAGLAPRYVEGLLKFLASELQSTRHVGVYAHWTQRALSIHCTALKMRSPQLLQTFNSLERSLRHIDSTLLKL